MASRHIAARWEAQFRHSAGNLLGRFYRAIERDAVLLGWRTRRGVSVPPVPGFDGDWVPVGPGATLVAHAPTLGADGDQLALVVVDGADNCSLWRVRASDGAALRAGTRLVACFAPQRSGSPRDVWFEVAQA